jgi:peptidoglycan/LPS O-acetylase OafA/YrhL
MTTATGQSRNQSLDVLRGIAVLSVLGCHSTYSPILRNVVGGVGVDLFFVLSGFLISGLLFDEYKKTGGIRIGRFLLRRGLKIWPSYYLLVLGCAALQLFNGSHSSKSQIISNCFLFKTTYQDTHSI